MPRHIYPPHADPSETGVVLLWVPAMRAEPCCLTPAEARALADTLNESAATAEQYRRDEGC